MKLRVLGVDPGSISGAIAMITDEQVFLRDMPLISKNVNASELARIIKEWRPDVAAIELVSAFPGQGVSSTFQFGRGFGTAIGVLGALEIPMEFYTPTRWKAFYNLQGKREDKDAGRCKAIELFPWVKGLELKKHSGRADALLIANYHKSRA